MRGAPAEVVFLDDDAAHECLARYARQHPGAWKVLKGTIESAGGRRVDDVPLIELRVRRHRVAPATVRAA